MRLYLLLAFGAGYGQLVFTGDTRAAAVAGYLVFSQQAGNAAGQCFDYFTRALLRRAVIETGTINSNADRFHLGEGMKNLGLVNQVLGGNAAPVQAHPTDLVFLDNSDLHAKLRGTDRGHVAAGTGADDCNVIHNQNLRPTLVRGAQDNRAVPS